MLIRPNSVKSPIRDFRDPQIHKIPGRIQQIPDRFSSGNSANTGDMFGSSGNSVAAAVDCDFYTDSLCLGVNQYPMYDTTFIQRDPIKFKHLENLTYLKCQFSGLKYPDYLEPTGD